MNSRSYLDRIGFRGSVAPTLECLQSLHRQHLFHVPFENLDIHLGRPLSLELEDLFDKIVVSRRGGFCYELNGLFAWLLGELGFETSLFSARVVGERGTPGPDFDHMGILVHLGERWLADVGFGDSFLEPLPLDSEEPSVEGSVRYRVVRGSDGRAFERRPEGEPWTVQYLFDLEPRAMSEFEGMCRYHQTSPESHFTRKTVCSLATPDGRITLSNGKLIETAGRRRRETGIPDLAKRERVLRERFGIELPSSLGPPSTAH